MEPKPRHPEQDDLPRPHLVELIDMRHELGKLEAPIDWELFESEWAGFFSSGSGRPATSPRLVAGFLYLQHAFELSEGAVGRDPLVSALLREGVLPASFFD